LDVDRDPAVFLDTGAVDRDVRRAGLGMLEEDRHLIILALDFEGTVGRWDVLFDENRTGDDIVLTWSGLHRNRCNRVIERGEITQLGDFFVLGEAAHHREASMLSKKIPNHAPPRIAANVLE
jgi:hypothetical protein